MSRYFQIGAWSGNIGRMRDGLRTKNHQRDVKIVENAGFMRDNPIKALEIKQSRNGDHLHPKGKTASKKCWSITLKSSRFQSSALSRINRNALLISHFARSELAPVFKMSYTASSTEP